MQTGAGSFDRWKWMASGLAVTATSAMADIPTQVYDLSGNFLASHSGGDHLSLNFDNGAGTLDVNFASTTYSSNLASGGKYTKVHLLINSTSFSARASEVFLRSHFTTSGAFFSTPGHTNVRVQAAAYYSGFTSYSFTTNYTISESANIPVAFTDSNINNGAVTTGTLLVASQATALAHKNGVSAEVVLVSLTYQLSASAQLESLKADLAGLVSVNNSKTVNKDLNQAIADLNKALAPGNFQSGDQMLGNQASSFFSGAEEAIKTLETLAKGKGVPTQIITQANSGVSVIALAGVQLARQTYQTAVNASGNPKDLTKALAALNAASSATGSTAVKDASEAWKFSIAAEK